MDTGIVNKKILYFEHQVTSVLGNTDCWFFIPKFHKGSENNNAKIWNPKHKRTILHLNPCNNPTSCLEGQYGKILTDVDVLSELAAKWLEYGLLSEFFKKFDLKMRFL